MLLAIALGTVLNPLNSSMIAVALVEIHDAFHVDLGTSTWLVSGFYLTGAVAQPLMGRLADLFGPRRVFVTGLSMATVLFALAPLSPSFGWLVATRACQALATSAAFPSGLGLIRSISNERVPARSLAVLSVAGSTSAALGPTIGGLVLSAWGWQGIFLVNLPLTLGAMVLAFLWLPSPAAADDRGLRVSSIDLPGVVLFATTLLPVLGALLAIGSGEAWLLLAVVPVAAALLAARELRHPAPFFDIRLLGRQPAMIGVFAQFAAVTFVFYSFFFAVPIWLEQIPKFPAHVAGLLVLPLTGMGVVATPVAARLISRSGPQLPLVLGSVFLLAGSVLVLLLAPGVSIAVILLITFVLGIPNAFNNLGLQAVLYQVTPRERISWAAGQYQTFRYVGATLAAAVLGSVFRTGSTTLGLHGIAMLLAAVAAALVGASVLARRGTPHQVPGAVQ